MKEEEQQKNGKETGVLLNSRSKLQLFLSGLNHQPNIYNNNMYMTTPRTTRRCELLDQLFSQCSPLSCLTH